MRKTALAVTALAALAAPIAEARTTYPWAGNCIGFKDYAGRVFDLVEQYGVDRVLAEAVTEEAQIMTISAGTAIERNARKGAFTTHMFGICHNNGGRRLGDGIDIEEGSAAGVQ